LWQWDRSNYLKYGDANTRWFHSRASMRKAKNAISGLRENEGVLQTSLDGITDVVTNFYGHLFSSSHPRDFAEVLDCVTPCVTETMNNTFCAPDTREEVDYALKQMHLYQAPVPDEMNPFLFQRFWDIIGNYITTAVISILNGHAIPPKLNHTFVAFIPKKTKSDLISDFYPISLCNVIYKLITKVISNRLKPLLPFIISDTQRAFVHRPLISDNILIAFGVLHAMHGDNATMNSMAIKLDMSKAFDRIEWPFC